MSFLDVLKKAGAVVTWPFTHAKMLVELLATTEKDAPAIKQVIVGIVQQFGTIETDVVAAIAQGGVNVITDVKALADIQAFFKFMHASALPQIEQIYTDYKLDLQNNQVHAVGPEPAAQSPVDPAPEAAAAETIQAGPGLHAAVAH
jgi:hypothetical protein